MKRLPKLVCFVIGAQGVGHVNSRWFYVRVVHGSPPQ